MGFTCSAIRKQNIVWIVVQLILLDKQQLKGRENIVPLLYNVKFINKVSS